MPTDWSTFVSDIAGKIKTKFDGNPSYVAIADTYDTSDWPELSITLDNEYNMEDEEIKSLGTLNFDELLPTTELDEMTEKVCLNIFCSIGNN